MGFSFGGLHPDVLHRRHHGRFVQIWNTVFACKQCLHAVAVVFTTESKQWLRSDTLEGISNDPQIHGFTVAEVYSKTQKADDPEHVPEEILPDFRDAVDCLRNGNFTPAGMMFRKVLERATIAIADDPASMRKKKLYHRIETLEEGRKLTPAMKDLAHVIRLEGNDAAHEDEEFDEARAKQLGDFAELFLLYAFTLPERVKRARGESVAD